MSETFIELNDSNEVKDSVNSMMSEDVNPKIQLCGEVTMEDNFGNKTFTRNKLLINGSTLALRKLFNIPSKYKFKTLNTILDINSAVALPVLPSGFEGPHMENGVALFCVGTGGSGTGFETVNQVKYNEVGVTEIIPFRHVQSPLATLEAAKYAMVKTDSGSGYTSYYGKKFEVTPEIKCLTTDGLDVPDNVETLLDDNIRTFVEIKLKITKDECREWFAVAGGGIESARINTLSLVAGIPVEISPGVNDYVDLRTFTKYNMKNEALEEGKEIYITYRIYI